MVAVPLLFCPLRVVVTPTTTPTENTPFSTIPRPGVLILYCGEKSRHAPGAFAGRWKRGGSERATSVRKGNSTSLVPKIYRPSNPHHLRFDSWPIIRFIPNLNLSVIFNAILLFIQLSLINIYKLVVLKVIIDFLVTTRIGKCNVINKYITLS